MDVQTSVERLASMSPFSENMDKINVHYVDETFMLGCHGVVTPGLCSFTAAKKAAMNCPHDQIAVFTKNMPKAMSPWGSGFMFLNTDQRFVHELGHSFGGLGDEYRYGQLYPAMEAPNCTKHGTRDKEDACPGWEWAEEIDPEIGCYRWCGGPNLFRPTQDSCHMHWIIEPYFCVVCERHLSELLAEYR